MHVSHNVIIVGVVINLNNFFIEYNK